MRSYNPLKTGQYKPSTEFSGKSGPYEYFAKRADIALGVI